MIKHHPDPQMLQMFAEGTLDPTLSLMVAAHCELCESCATYVDTLSSIHAESVSNQIVDDRVGEDLSRMFQSITTTHFVEGFDFSQPPANAFPESIEVEGKAYKIPKPLRRYASRQLTWSRYLGKLSHATVDIGGNNLAQFVFMEPGGSVPEHTHRGNEYTLVLDGQFCDGINEYSDGDLAVLNGNHSHSPIVNTKEGCLVFTVLDKPLHFTSGWAKLINPLSHLFFNASVDK